MGFPVSAIDAVSSAEVRDSRLGTRARTYRSRAKTQRRALLIVLLISDALALAAALLGAWYLRIGSDLLPYTSAPDLTGYVQTTIASVFVLLAIFASSGLYDYNLILGGPQEYGAIFRAASFGMVAIVFFSFFQRTTTISRGWLLIAWALSIVLVGGARFTLRRLIWWLRRTRAWFMTSTLIVGANEHGRAISNQLGQKNSGIHLVGFLDDFLPVGSRVGDDLRVLGVPSQLNDLARQHAIEQVIVVPNAVSWETFQDLIKRNGSADDYQLQLSPGFYEILTTSVQVTQKAFVPLLRIRNARITGIDRVLKSSLDYALGAILGVLTAPIQVLIALPILVLDGPPILVRHNVFGLQGRKFDTLKFRTEAANSAKADGLKANLAKAPLELTRIGAFLQRTSLDKLPQLINVLRGEMSLVGPRTVSKTLEQEYRPWLRNLLTVKPGWTGPWATNPPDTLEAEMRIMLYYIRNWTIWTDLQVLFRSVTAVLTR